MVAIQGRLEIPLVLLGIPDQEAQAAMVAMVEQGALAVETGTGLVT
jgi:hypothetical protein